MPRGVEQQAKKLVQPHTACVAANRLRYRIEIPQSVDPEVLPKLAAGDVKPYLVPLVAPH